MKPSERDQLLIRLDERSQNTWRSVEKIETHMDSINSSIYDHGERIATIEGAGFGPKTKLAGLGGVLLLIASNVLIWLRQQSL